MSVNTHEMEDSERIRQVKCYNRTGLVSDDDTEKGHNHRSYANSITIALMAREHILCFTDTRLGHTTHSSKRYQ